MGLRIGIVGCGFIGRVHSFALYGLIRGGLVDAEVARTHDLDPSRAADLAAVHGCDVAPDLDALIGAVDVVWVCTPTAAHAPVVEAATAAGRAVFCEKPLGRDLAEAQRVAAALARVPHQVGLVLRWAPVWTALVGELASGRHGRPMALLLRDDQYFPNQGIYGSTWREDAGVAGGGTLLEHSIHDLDLFRLLLGDPEAVTCRTASFAGYPGVEDVATVEAAYPGGVQAALVSVWHRVLSRPSTRRLELFCEDALLWTEDDNTGPLHRETSVGSEVVECPPPEWAAHLGVPEAVQKPLAPYAAAAKAFLECVAQGRDGSPGAPEALAAHRLVDAAYRSAARGGVPVTL